MVTEAGLQRGLLTLWVSKLHARCRIPISEAVAQPKGSMPLQDCPA